MYSIDFSQKIMLIIAFFSIFSTQLFSQSFADRLSIYTITSCNIDGFDGNYEPAALSIGIEPQFSIHNMFSISIKYETGLTIMGSRGRSSYAIPVQNMEFVETESPLKLISNIGLKFHIEPKLFNTKMFMSFGGHYYWQRSGLYKRYDLNNNLISTLESQPLNSIGNTFSFGYYFNRMKVYYTFNSAENKEGDFLFDLPQYSGLTFSYQIFGKAINNISDQQAKLPIFTIGLGTEFLLPFSENATAPVWTEYLETKLFIMKKISIGYKFHPFTNKPLGEDNKENEWVIFCCNYNNVEYIHWIRKERLSETIAKNVNLEYYLPNNNGWFTMGVGLSQYKINNIESVTGKDFLGNIKNTTEISEKTNLGPSLTAGIKTTLTKSKLEIHFTGKGIPNYFSISTGIELGCPKFWKN